ncbi:11315_t:CDS:2 [Funneliformis caledonium]|uniref:11315_t:CDS:1 n=1 Tax=Funneliformis caledonium TaxID=1117310 RepID=A0A9N9A021_9GLOM|nr:11315_t:CDS:2 [Funneliformis caledonium]
MDEFKVISSKNTVNNSIEIYDQFQKQELCLLATCAHNAPNESSIILFKSNIVASVHFCCDNSKLKAFRFTYDLESLQFDEKSLSNLFINYSLIEIPSAYFTLREKFSLEMSLSKTKRRTYDVSDKLLFTCDDLKFVSRFNLFNQANPNDSNLGFANITSKHLIFKSLQSFTKKELHISIFCTPLKYEK